MSPHRLSHKSEIELHKTAFCTMPGESRIKFNKHFFTKWCLTARYSLERGLRWPLVDLSEILEKNKTKKRSNSDPLIFQVSSGFDIFRLRLSSHCTNTSSTQIRPLFNFPSSRTHILWIVKLKMVTRPLISLTSASKEVQSNLYQAAPY